MTETKIDLMPFCTSPGRQEPVWGSAMTNPFVKNGWRYATNGKICVRIPAIGEPEESGTRPDVEALFKKFTPSSCSLAWPANVRLRLDFKCPKCGGDGKGTCGECGERTAPCSDCDHGVINRDVARVGSACIDGDLYGLICALPDVLFADPESKKMIYFVFDGGEGCVIASTKGEVA